MKFTFTALALLACLSTSASAKEYSFVYEKKMSLADCKISMSMVASRYGFTLQEWQKNDFYLLNQGEHAGNAYYSQGTCYIYIQ